jgi:hypothetical protein
VKLIYCLARVAPTHFPSEPILAVKMLNDVPGASTAKTTSALPVGTGSITGLAGSFFTGNWTFQSPHAVLAVGVCGSALSTQYRRVHKSKGCHKSSPKHYAHSHGLSPAVADSDSPTAFRPSNRRDHSSLSRARPESGERNSFTEQKSIGPARSANPLSAVGELRLLVTKFAQFQRMRRGPR